MPIFARCPSCGKHDWTDKHKCPPKWAIYRADDPGGDPSIMFGADATDAAEQYAAEHDAGDYDMMKGEELILVICTNEERLANEFETEAEFDTCFARQPRYECKGYMIPEYKATLQKTAATPV